MANQLKIKAGSGKVGQDKIIDVMVVMLLCTHTYVHTYVPRRAPLVAIEAVFMPTNTLSHVIKIIIGRK